MTIPPGEPLPEVSVANQYGLEPLRPELYVSQRDPVTSRSLVATEVYTTGSEYGGVAGVIQPAPHLPSASERLRMVYAIDPTDPGSEVGSILAPELEGNY